MAGAAPARQQLPRLQSAVRNFAGGWNRIGSQIAFCVIAVGLIPTAMRRYKVETLRVIAQMSLGVGALAAIGGSVVVITFLSLVLGPLVAGVAHKALGQIGIDALAGFFSANVMTRTSAPFLVNFALSVTIGAGATAQLGAMRISEEIDALEVMGIRSISYLASTRLVAAVVIAVPFFCLAAMSMYVTFSFSMTIAYGGAAGAYDHYFYSYLIPMDILRSMLQAVVTALVVMLMHTYYGFTASGGPAGVGEAVGRSVRASMIVTFIATLGVAMAAYGQSGDFNFSG